MWKELDLLSPVGIQCGLPASREPQPCCCHRCLPPAQSQAWPTFPRPGALCAEQSSSSGMPSASHPVSLQLLSVIKGKLKASSSLSSWVTSHRVCPVSWVGTHLGLETPKPQGGHPQACLAPGARPQALACPRPLIAPLTLGSREVPLGCSEVSHHVRLLWPTPGHSWAHGKGLATHERKGWQGSPSATLCAPLTLGLSLLRPVT